MILFHGNQLESWVTAKLVYGPYWGGCVVAQNGSQLACEVPAGVGAGHVVAFEGTRNGSVTNFHPSPEIKLSYQQPVLVAVEGAAALSTLGGNLVTVRGSGLSVFPGEVSVHYGPTNDPLRFGAMEVTSVSDSVLVARFGPGVGRQLRLTVIVGGQMAVSRNGSVLVHFAAPQLERISLISSDTLGLATSLDRLPADGIEEVRIRLHGTGFGPAAQGRWTLSASVGANDSLLGISHLTDCQQSSQAPQTQLDCSVFGGVGSSNQVVVTVAGQRSSAGIGTPTLGFAPPTLASVRADTQHTTGGGVFSVFGSNFGPDWALPSGADWPGEVRIISWNGEPARATGCQVGWVYDADLSALSLSSVTGGNATNATDGGASSGDASSAPPGTRRLDCVAPEGAGANLGLYLVLDDQQSSVLADAISYSGPVVARFSSPNGEARAAVSTRGGSVVLIHGSDLGPGTVGSLTDPSLVEVRYQANLGDMPLPLVGSGANPAVVSADGSVVTMWPRSCRVAVAHELLNCTMGAGAGRQLHWEVIVANQSSTTAAPTYAAPQITAITDADGMSRVDATTASRAGGTQLLLHGKNFGPRSEGADGQQLTDGSLEAPPMLQAVAFGPAASPRQFQVDSDQLAVLSHERVAITLPPGIGASLAVSVLVGGQWSQPSQQSISYAAPQAVLAIPGRIPTAGSGSTGGQEGRLCGIGFTDALSAGLAPFVAFGNPADGSMIDPIPAAEADSVLVSEALDRLAGAGTITNLQPVQAQLDLGLDPTLQCVAFRLPAGAGLQRQLRLVIATVTASGALSTVLATSTGLVTASYADPEPSYMLFGSLAERPELVATANAQFGSLSVANNPPAVLTIVGSNFGAEPSTSDSVGRTVVVQTNNGSDWAATDVVVVTSWLNDRIVVLTQATALRMKLRITSKGPLGGEAPNQPLQQESVAVDLSTIAGVISSLTPPSLEGASTAGGELLGLSFNFSSIATAGAFQVMVEFPMPSAGTQRAPCPLAVPRDGGSDGGYEWFDGSAVEQLQVVQDACAEQNGMQSPSALSGHAGCTVRCFLPPGQGADAAVWLHLKDSDPVSTPPLVRPPSARLSFAPPRVSSALVQDDTLVALGLSQEPRTHAALVAATGSGGGKPRLSIQMPTTGAVVTLAGSNFGLEPQVLVAGSPIDAEDVTVLRNGSLLQVALPPGQGLGDVISVSVGGQPCRGPSDLFQGLVDDAVSDASDEPLTIVWSYFGPRIHSARPLDGNLTALPTQGGVPVVVIGRDFGTGYPPPQVTFQLPGGASRPCSDSTKVSHLELQCLAPAGMGVAEVSVSQIGAGLQAPSDWQAASINYLAPHIDRISFPAYAATSTTTSEGEPILQMPRLGEGSDTPMWVELVLEGANFGVPAAGQQCVFVAWTAAIDAQAPLLCDGQLSYTGEGEAFDGGVAYESVNASTFLRHSAAVLALERSWDEIAAGGDATLDTSEWHSNDIYGFSDTGGAAGSDGATAADDAFAAPGDSSWPSNVPAIDDAATATFAADSLAPFDEFATSGASDTASQAVGDDQSSFVGARRLDSSTAAATRSLAQQLVDLAGELDAGRATGIPEAIAMSLDTHVFAWSHNEIRLLVPADVALGDWTVTLQAGGGLRPRPRTGTVALTGARPTIDSLVLDTSTVDTSVVSLQGWGLPVYDVDQAQARLDHQRSRWPMTLPVAPSQLPPLLWWRVDTPFGCVSNALVDAGYKAAAVGATDLGNFDLVRPAAVESCTATESARTHSSSSIVLPPGVGGGHVASVSVGWADGAGQAVAQPADGGLPFDYNPPYIEFVRPTLLQLHGSSMADAAANSTLVAADGLGASTTTGELTRISLLVGNVGTWELSQSWPYELQSINITIGGRPCFSAARTRPEEGGVVVDGNVECWLDTTKMSVGPATVTLVAAGNRHSVSSSDSRAPLAVCAPGSFGGVGTSCLPCPLGAVCDGYVNGMHRPPRPTAGFYNLNGTEQLACPSQGSAYAARGVCIVPCEPAEACNADNRCARGYRSNPPHYRCAACNSGSYRISGACEACPEQPWARVALCVAVAVLVCALVYLGSCLELDLALLSIGVDQLQVLALFANARIPWPPALRRAFLSFSVLNVNLELAAPDCVVPGFSYETNWYLIEGLPMAAATMALSLFVVYYLVKRCILGQQGRRSLCSHLDTATSTIVMLLLVLYLVVVRMALDVFACSPLTPSDGRRYMRSVFEECGQRGGLQARLAPLASASVVLYGLALPAVLGVVLWHNRYAITLDQMQRAYGMDSTGVTRHDVRAARRMRARFAPAYHMFKPFYAPYWVLVVLARKLFIALVVLVFDRNAAAQAALMLLILFIAYAMQVRNNPYMPPASFARIVVQHRQAVETASCKDPGSAASRSAQSLSKLAQADAPARLAAHTRLAADLSAIHTEMRRRTQRLHSGWRMSALKSSGSLIERTQLVLFDWNTVEATMLACSVLIALSGVMFASQGSSELADDHATAVGAVALIVLIVTCLYAAGAFCLEVMQIVLAQRKARRSAKATFGNHNRRAAAIKAFNDNRRRDSPEGEAPTALGPLLDALGGRKVSARMHLSEMADMADRSSSESKRRIEMTTNQLLIRTETAGSVDTSKSDEDSVSGVVARIDFDKDEAAQLAARVFDPLKPPRDIAEWRQACLLYEHLDRLASATRERLGVLKRAEAVRARARTEP